MEFVPAASTIDTYNLATEVFNAEAYLGDYCNRCKVLPYLAFRQGTNYVTAGATQLTL